MLTIIVNGTPLIRFLYSVSRDYDYMNIEKFVKGYAMIYHNGKACKHYSTFLAIATMRHQISSSTLGQQRNGSVKIWNEICLWRLKMDLTSYRLHRPFASKDFNIHVRTKKKKDFDPSME